MRLTPQPVVFLEYNSLLEMNRGAHFEYDNNIFVLYTNMKSNFGFWFLHDQTKTSLFYINPLSFVNINVRKL